MLSPMGIARIRHRRTVKKALRSPLKEVIVPEVGRKENTAFAPFEPLCRGSKHETEKIKGESARRGSMCGPQC